MKGLSKKEIEAVSDLEFGKKYYFTAEDIKSHFNNKKQMTNIIYTLRKKGRIMKISKSKYFLVPIKARTGRWLDNPAIVADEMFDGENYYIGGWYAANYWRLTDQIPMQIDIYTTKRQGKTRMFNIRFAFHRTTKKSIAKESTVQEAGGHKFKIIKKEHSIEWMKSKK